MFSKLLTLGLGYLWINLDYSSMETGQSTRTEGRRPQSTDFLFSPGNVAARSTFLSIPDSDQVPNLDSKSLDTLGSSHLKCRTFRM